MVNEIIHQTSLLFVLAAYILFFGHLIQFLFNAVIFFLSYLNVLKRLSRKKESSMQLPENSVF